MNAGCVAKAVDATVPYMLDKLFLAHWASLVEHEVFQDSRFLARERQGLTAGGGDARLGVKAELSAG